MFLFIAERVVIQVIKRQGQVGFGRRRRKRGRQAKVIGRRGYITQVDAQVLQVVFYLVPFWCRD
jgi:hypothetical protein